MKTVISGSSPTMLMTQNTNRSMVTIVLFRALFAVSNEIFRYKKAPRHHCLGLSRVSITHDLSRELVETLANDFGRARNSCKKRNAPAIFDTKRTYSIVVLSPVYNVIDQKAKGPTLSRVGPFASESISAIFEMLIQRSSRCKERLRIMSKVRHTE